MFYNSFSHLVKTSLDGRWLKKEITDRSIAAVGSMAPPFIEKDIDGKMLDIRSFRNKNYVILYIWASWCVRPDGESPHLKQLYAKYHAKGLEVVSLSLDFFVKDWKDAIKKHGMVKWHHVWVNQIERLHSIYDIGSMPPSFLILIDKNSKIIGRYIDENGMKFKIDNGDSEGTLADLDKKLQQVMPGK